MDPEKAKGPIEKAKVLIDKWTVKANARRNCWAWPMWIARLNWADFDPRPFGLVTDLSRKIRHVGSDVDWVDSQ